MTAKIKPELMSPAGHWAELQTAIEAGADAVYFGLNHFSARAKIGFDLAELPEVMETLHQRGVKGFLTFNTLVFDHELRQAELALLAIAAAGVDAIIVQDIGIVKLAKQIAPDLNIHGSTQMSITSAQGADLAASLGCNRVVLGRELSLKDIRKIASETDVELEVFVHGALCVSYSGQCFSSEAWGGRSANRGKCAQACRLSYDLIVDGHKKELEDLRYLLSPGDLYALEQIPELVAIGVHCLKIEGRYKDANYVAVTTNAYRNAIDLAMLGVKNEISLQEKTDIEQVYSRGLGPHFISGINHQNVVIGRSPRNRGVHVGCVTDTDSRKNNVTVKAIHPLKRGDGIVFDAASWRSPDEPEEGGHIYEVTPVGAKDVRPFEKAPAAQGALDASDTLGQHVRLEFGRREIDISRIRIGDLVWRTLDPQLPKRLKPLTHPGQPVSTHPVSFVVVAEVGQPIKVSASLESGLTREYTGETALEPASKRALDLEALTEKLGRLGGTPYHLSKIDFSNSTPVFLPTSQLNQIRRALVDALFDARGETRPIAARPAIDQWMRDAEIVPTFESTDTDPSIDKPVQLHVLVRSKEQLVAAISAAPASITLDYLELYGLRDSVELIRAAGIPCRVASPRILKPAEQKVARFLISLDCEILVRSAGLLSDLLKEESVRGKLIGDFSLNASNFIAFKTYLAMGLKRITPTYDLNGQQIEELTNYIAPENLEVIAFSHLPVFHTEHCVFCRFLSEGTDSSNCGHPCEKHQITMRDHSGREHPVLADVGCRNTVFNAEVQIDPDWIERWRQVGIRDFRIEFVHQSPEEVGETIAACTDLLTGDLSADDLAKGLNQSGQTTAEGSLFVPAGFKDLVQLR